MADNPVKVVWLPINQAYLVMWNDTRLAGPTTKEGAQAYLDEHDLEATWIK